MNFRNKSFERRVSSEMNIAMDFSARSEDFKNKLRFEFSNTWNDVNIDLYVAAGFSTIE